MSDEIFHLLHQWEEPALWECLIKWDKRHRAQLEYARGIPLRHKDERVEAIAIADKYAGLMSAKFGELLAVREAVERIAPDLADPLDVRGPAEIVSPIDRARAVRDLVRKLKSHLHAEPANAVPSTPAGGQQAEGEKPRTTKKRSTERGEGRTKLIAALIAHHKYAGGSCLNPAPIGNNELAKAAAVSTSTASTFFNKEFEGHTKYRAICRDIGKLVNSLKLLSGEFSPHVLYGSEPPEKRRDGRRSRRSRQESNDD